MSGIKRIVQRLQIPLQSAVDPLYAHGRAWHRRCGSMPAAQYEQLLMGSLRELIAHFHRYGLCDDPAYGQVYGSCGYAALMQLPVLTRNRLRALFPRLRQINRLRRGIAEHTSGGSTGDPIQFLHSRRLQRLAGGCNLGMYMLLGWHPGMPRFSLWGHEPGQPPERRRLGTRARLRRWLQHTTAFGGYLPADGEYLAFLEAVRANPGCAVFGFTSLLESCAILMKERGLELPAGFLATAWACSEMLAERQRALIEDAFGVALRRHYGSRECSTIAADCAEGTLHISPRYIIEAVDPLTHSPLPAGEAGSLLITDLFNDATPFIRYEIGDLGAVDWRDCACGRSGPCLAEFNGRTAGLFTLPSGTRVSALCFAAIYNHFPTLGQCQAIRTGPAEFELRYIGSRIAEEERLRLEQMTSDLLEGSAVRVTLAGDLERSPTGKLICFHDLIGNVTA